MLLSLINEKGGVGKSTIAAHLVGYLVEKHPDKLICFVDCDPQESCSRWLSSVFEDEISLFQHTDYDSIVANLKIYKAKFDYVVCDAPGAMREEVRGVLHYTDLAMVPVTPSMLDVDSTNQAILGIKQVRDYRNGQPDAVLIPNRIQKTQNIAKDLFAALDSLEIPRTQNFVRALTRYADAPGQGTLEIDNDIRNLFEEALSHASQEA